jgi:hypothetical protein
MVCDGTRWNTSSEILTGEAYPVSPKQIAVKLIEHMLEHGRANQRWKHTASSSETVDSSGVAKATIVGEAEQKR